MRKTIKFAENKQCFFHGGSPVLYLLSRLPTGGTAAERHLTALAERLTAYTKEELLPIAKREWETAAMEGHGYRFSPHRVTVFAKTSPETRCRITLCFSVQTGESETRSAELVTEWSEDLAFQRRRRGKKHFTWRVK